MSVKVGFVGNVYKDKLIHRIVAIEFVHKQLGSDCVNHKDGNKLNNKASNLEWTTQRENVIHSIANNLINPRTRSVKQFTKTGQFVNEFKSTTLACKSIGLSRSSIEKACNGLNPTAGGFIWKFNEPNAQCDLTDSKCINGFLRYKITPSGCVYSTLYKRSMKLQTNTSGYKLIQFSVKSVKKNYYIHQLVALNYIPNPDKKKFVNHKDGNKSNNSVDNLEWVTQSENTIHYYKELRKIQS